MPQTQSLHQFMTRLNENSVRTKNLFEMKVHVPDIGTSGKYASGIDITRYLNPNFTYYGQGFDVPSRTIQYTDVGFKGFKVPVPTIVQMAQEHTVTLNADINGEMRRAFLAWQALTINPQIDSDGGYFEGNRLLEDTGKIYIHLLDPTYRDKHRTVESYTIYGVTVEDVGQLSFSNTDSSLATFTVKFRSQYWQYGDAFSSLNGPAGNDFPYPIK